MKVYGKKIGIPPSLKSLIVCKNSYGQEVQGIPLHFTSFRMSFETYAPSSMLRMSEVLSDFKITLDEQVIYSGKAVVSNLINTGEVLVCEVTLDDYWTITNSSSPDLRNKPRCGFDGFLRQWQNVYKVVPEFKVVVADMRTLLADMRLWLGQLELSIGSTANGNQEKIEIETAQELAAPILSTIDSLGDRFEEIASRLEPDLRPVHIHFTRHNLHSLLFCSPFAYRTFHKPLGYAGDYMMVNMILRNPYEGASLYAKVINAWFLNQLPAQAHRNRIIFLKQKLADEILRINRLNKRPARIFNLGCGPASEIQEFLSESELCDHASFNLLDFNEETIQYTSRCLHDISKQFTRKTRIQMQKKTVQQLLKEALALQKNAKPDGEVKVEKYDFVYCAGLFDYLTDNVCKQLIGVFYEWLAPGGLLLVTNVDGTRPFRNKLELILDWNLIYRNAQQIFDLKPDDAPAEICSVKSDSTSVNVFLEVRKPENA